MRDPFTAKFAFNPANRLSLGVEEEVWTVDPTSGLLVPGALKAFANDEEAARWPQCKPELPAQQIEAVTPICRSVRSLERALRRNAAMLHEIAHTYGFAISRAPLPEKSFEIQVFPKPRYLEIERRFGERLRGAYVSGLHVHVGVGSPDEALRVINACRIYLPVFLSISARSSLFAGTQTSYKSYRYVKYREMAGEVVPPYLTSWEYFTDIARDRGFGEDPRMCWWAIRISPHGTVELRICDVQEDPKITLGIAALFRVLARDAIGARAVADYREVEIIERELHRASAGVYDHVPFLERTIDVASKSVHHAEEIRYIQSLLS